MSLFNLDIIDDPQAFRNRSSSLHRPYVGSPLPECRPVTPPDISSIPQSTILVARGAAQLELDLFSTGDVPSENAHDTQGIGGEPELGSEATDTPAACAFIPPPAMAAPDPIPSGDARPATLWACLQYLETRTDLPATLSRDAGSAVSVVQRMVDNPTGSKRQRRSSMQPVGESLPADPRHLRPILEGLQPAIHGITHARYLRITSAITSMLQRCGWIGRVLWPGIPQADGYDTLWKSARAHLHERAGPLGPAFLYWHERGLGPEDVRSIHLEEYVQYRAENSIRKDPRETGMQLTSAWNRMIAIDPEWPRARLQLPSLQRPRKSPEMSALPPSIQTEFEQYLTRLAEPDDRMDDVSDPLSLSSIHQHRNWLLRALGCLQANGLPLDQFHRLALLVEPDNFWAILVALRKEFDNAWSQTAKQVALAMLTLARRWVRPDTATLEELKRLARKVRLRRSGLSSRNIDSLEQFDTDEKRQALLDVPLVAYANVQREIQSDGCVTAHAARLHEIALALEILFTQPIRGKNLAGLAERHFKYDRGGTLIRIHIPHSETKTRNRDIDIQIPPELAQRIKRHWEVFRPFLLCGQKSSPYLFPGTKGNPRRPANLSNSIKGFIMRELGASFTPHMIRHLAVAMLLDDNPNNMPVASRLLSHANVKITGEIYGVLLTSAAQSAWLEAADGVRKKAARKENRRGQKKP